MDNFLVKLIGFKATLIQGDFLVIDRWNWLKKYLLKSPNKKLIDIGSGSGAFTIGSSKYFEYNSLGLSWDERNLTVSQKRAQILGVSDKTNFEICDVRFLDKRTDLFNLFDVAICTENIEHILNDKKLISDISKILKVGGILLLTTPNYDYVPMGIGDSKTLISKIEDGAHVRIGYTRQDCINVCEGTGLDVKCIEFCSGFFSQKLTALLRFLTKYISYYPSWILLLPFRILPFLFDKTIERIFKWPGYSICFVAEKIN